MLALRVRWQDHRQRGPKVYTLHAPEVECIGKSKARALRVRLQGVDDPATKPRDGQFVLHARRCLAATPRARSSPSWNA